MDTKDSLSSQSKIKILYIAGCGRSGSTLLDMALTTAPEALSVGQFENFIYYKNGYDPQRPNKQRFLDDQDAAARDSLLWADVVKAVEQDALAVYDPRCPMALGRVILQVLRGHIPSIASVDDDKLYATILEKARQLKGQQVCCIVDSSKNIKRLIALLQHPELEVYVIHLIRDVRGVVYSHSKRGKPWVAALRRWIVLNACLSVLLARTLPRSRSIRVVYDRFTHDPGSTLASINQAFNFLHVPVEQFLPALQKEPSYRFSGSGMRLKPIAAIKHDVAWRSGLTYGQKFVIGCAAGVMNRLWCGPNRDEAT